MADEGPKLPAALSAAQQIAKSMQPTLAAASTVDHIAKGMQPILATLRAAESATQGMRPALSAVETMMEVHEKAMGPATLLADIAEPYRKMMEPMRGITDLLAPLARVGASVPDPAGRVSLQVEEFMERERAAREEVERAMEREHAAKAAARQAQLETATAMKEVAASSKKLAESSKAQPKIQWWTAIVGAVVCAILGALLTLAMTRRSEPALAHLGAAPGPTTAQGATDANACVPDARRMTR